ncbi:MAG: spore germination protein [Crocinitomix sp.]|jgi:spore germination protein
MNLIQYIILALFLLKGLITCAQEEVTITIAYPDDESYFIYSIPPTDENARFGGMYYFKVENTGSVALENWKINTLWKGLNSTWGVVEKTVINPGTGEIQLNGPVWDLNLNVGEDFVLSGEWLTTSSIEDWIEYLPRAITMDADTGPVSIIYNTEGELTGPDFSAQKVKPLDSDLKTFEDLKIVAYFPIFDAENAWCSLQRYGQNIDQLRVQLYSINPEGQLRAGQDLPDGVDPIEEIHYWYDYITDLGVVEYCSTHDIELIPVVFNYNPEIGDFDQMAVHSMMLDPTLKDNHIADIISVLEDKSTYAGIDVDYESLMASDKDNYSTFMEDLADAVHETGKIITTAVHTKVGPGTWYGPQAQDYERIGNAVDEILFMTYDLHWATSPTYADPPPTAGCQSTPDWMNDVACFAISEIDDPSKIQLGLPFYGYRWKSLFEEHTLDDPGVGLTYKEALALINHYDINPELINREDNGNEPFFNVLIDGIEWTCYYQDGASLNYKLTALDEHDLRDYIGGIGIWRLGGENDAMWNAITMNVKGNAPIINSEFDCTGFTELPDIADNIQIELFPNPATDELHLIVPEIIIITSYSIIDISGKTVFYSNSFNSTIAIEHLEKGSYVLRLKVGSSTFVNKTFLKS